MKATLQSLASAPARRGGAACTCRLLSLRSILIPAFLSALLMTASAWAVPMLVYLDFDGHTDGNYPSGNVAISLPPFVGGQTIREEIRRHMEEDFAPFDVVFVTSDDMPQPPAEVDGGYREQTPAIRVAIGGKVGDLAGNQSGLATNPYARNTVWVVEFQSDGATRRSEAEIGNTASHELGHAFGHLAAHAAPWSWLQIPSQITHYLAEPVLYPVPTDNSRASRSGKIVLFHHHERGHHHGAGYVVLSTLLGCSRVGLRHYSCLAPRSSQGHAAAC